MSTGVQLGEDITWTVEEGQNQDDLSKEMVSLETLSDLTGFPLEFLKNELLIEGKISHDNKINMADLRKAMCVYLKNAFPEETDPI